MIDLGVSKLALIAVVALVVIGPERLPKVARMAGNLLGRAQRYMAEVKSEVNRQVELDELKKMQEAATSAMQDVKSSMNDVGSTLNEAKQGLSDDDSKSLSSSSSYLNEYDDCCSDLFFHLTHLIYQPSECYGLINGVFHESNPTRSSHHL
jgi:sec-independent protein translocase protein TatB